MKLGSNITIKNVLQVYVTTTTIFYAIFSKEMRTSHVLTGVGGRPHYSVFQRKIRSYSLEKEIEK